MQSTLKGQPKANLTMTSTNEKFCLKWNDFQQNIISNYQELRRNSDFSDVTLVCEDDQQVEAHQVILSASSPFFMKVLRNNKHSHPMIYMRGLKAKDLLSIVNFIYTGETNILHEDLDDFLTIADDIQLKGLTGNPKVDLNEFSKKPNQNLPKRSETNKTNYDINPNVDLKTPPHTLQEISTYEMSEISACKEEAMDSFKTSIVSVDSPDELDRQISSMMQKLDGKHWSCTVCGKNARDKTNMVQHIEANHIEGVSHPCDQCEKVSRSRHALAKHIYQFHKSQYLINNI